MMTPNERFKLISRRYSSAVNKIEIGHNVRPGLNFDSLAEAKRFIKGHSLHVHKSVKALTRLFDEVKDLSDLTTISNERKAAIQDKMTRASCALDKYDDCIIATHLVDDPDAPGAATKADKLSVDSWDFISTVQDWNASQTVFWPCLRNEIIQQGAACTAYQSVRPSLPVEPEIVTTANHPMQKLGADMFPIAGHEFVLLVDQCLGYPFIKRLKTISAAKSTAFLAHICHMFGFPDSIWADGGPQFRAVAAGPNLATMRDMAPAD
ncbi:hypothetical protein TCAL_15004 [Tigriopus californicus]|uniref:Integrase catalytic domain-containing protein n=1 Tax=Tigriopus californicus TaxID=6832 RepID=A0A553NY74_TIGCA|nr:hypothetical protein TCAL_15004 [Tigriopus californicus]